jgi:hypothetical protein
MIVPFTDRVQKAWVSELTGRRTTRVCLTLATSAEKDVTPRLSIPGSRRAMTPAKSGGPEGAASRFWIVPAGRQPRLAGAKTAPGGKTGTRKTKG